MSGSLTPWPILPMSSVELKESRVEIIDSCVEKLIANQPVLTSPPFFGPGVRAGWRPGPTLYLEDHREIDYVTDKMARCYEYRSMALAGDGDIILLSRAPDSRFEEYLRNTLGLGAPTVLHVSMIKHGGKQSLAHSCLADTQAMKQLIACARSAGGINIMPFISSGYVWLLARAISNAADVVVRVAGAPPVVSRMANNKLWFTQRVKDIFGQQSVPPTYRAFGPAAAVARLRYLAQRNPRVVLKTPSSAGSMGNLVFESAEVLGISFVELRDYILNSLRGIGWDDDYPVLVSVWENSVIASPSAQLWIPDQADGPPILEGIFEQVLQGVGGQFVGAEPAELPGSISGLMTHQAIELAILLQKLGYFGRVSLDGLLVGEKMGSAELHWIECNARWGGVSIPMTLAHRLSAGTKLTSLVIVQKASADYDRVSIETLKKNTKVRLFDHRLSEAGIALLSPISAGECAVIFVSLAKTREEARAMALSTCEELHLLRTNDTLCE